MQPLRAVCCGFERVRLLYFGRLQVAEDAVEQFRLKQAVGFRADAEVARAVALEALVLRDLAEILGDALLEVRDVLHLRLVHELRQRLHIHHRELRVLARFAELFEQLVDRLEFLLHLLMS